MKQNFQKRPIIYCQNFVLCNRAILYFAFYIAFCSLYGNVLQFCMEMLRF